jgi:ankyrin repeat domain-containing protein 50
VFCQLDALKRCRKKKALLEALETLPKTLDDTYERILTSVEKDYQQEVRRALIWLAFSRRPLRIEELAEAAVVDSNLSPPFDPEERLHDPCNDILEILGSLVTISSEEISNNALDDIRNSDLDGALWVSDLDVALRDSDLDVTLSDSDYDLTDSTGKEIRLAHFSVKEYLLSNRIGISSASEFRATSVEADRFMSESCLQYILHYDQSDSRTTSPKDLEYFPLLQYACEFWYIHARSISVGGRKSIDSVISRLFSSDTVLVAWLRVHRPDMSTESPFSVSGNFGLPLYYASYIGLESVVRLLLEHKADVDAKGYGGRTVLFAAAYGGHEVIVRLLLEHKADVDAKDDSGWTALYAAAHRGHEAVVRLLLEHKADVDAKNNSGLTALSAAAGAGHEAVVQLLNAG